jgi:hypothetical protein
MKISSRRWRRFMLKRQWTVEQAYLQQEEAMERQIVL